MDYQTSLHHARPHHSSISIPAIVGLGALGCLLMFSPPAEKSRTPELELGELVEPGSFVVQHELETAWQPDEDVLDVAAPRVNLSDLRLSGRLSRSERQLIRTYAERHGQDVVIHRVPSRERRQKLVQEQQVDVAIGRMPLDDLPEGVAPSQPLERIQRVLVTRTNDPSPERVVVQQDEPLLEELQQDDSLTLTPVTEYVPQWQLLAQVIQGSADATVTWQDDARHVFSKHPWLEVGDAVGEPLPVGWVVPEDRVILREELNRLITESVFMGELDRPLQGDLDTIKERGVLRVLMPHGPRSFFLHRGERMGRDHELAAALAEELGVELRVMLPSSAMSMEDAISQGFADVLMGYPESFLQTSDQALVTDAYSATPAQELEYTRDGVLRGQLDEAGEDADSLDVVMVMRGDDLALYDVVQRFLDEQSESGQLDVLERRYKRAAMKQGGGEDASDEYTLSDFDELFKTHAGRQGFDWRLIAAQAFQESSFDPDAKSWAGATGLMQLMPSTAKWIGVQGKLRDPATSIKGGVKYMSWLARTYERQGLQPEEVIRFSLASYNAGQGHIEDARRIAASLGRDPDRWYDNVEYAVTLLSEERYARQARYGYCRCAEVVDYVRRIERRYLDYVTYLERAPSSGQESVEAIE